MQRTRTQLIFDAIVTWQRKTFTASTPQSKIHHLMEEVMELKNAIANESDSEIRKELADCFILLFGVADSLEMEWPDVLETIREKFEIIQSRNWGTPDENGVVKHIKS